MDENKINSGITAIAIIVLMALMALSLLISCKTREVVRHETVTVHDTLQTSRTDTLVDIKVITLKDTVKQSEFHYITLNNNGDTIKEVHHFHEKEKIIIVDSTKRYQAKIDSLQQKINKMQKQYQAKKQKHLTWKETISIILSIIVIALAMAIFIKYAAKGKK